MIIQLPRSKVAPPLRAILLVQPLASFDPIPNNAPPIKAKAHLFLFVILGPLFVSFLSLPDKAPDISPPANVPNIAKIYQKSRGFFSPPPYFAR